MPIAPPDSTLAAIEQKVRRLTRSPSLQQLTEADLENYINTFVVYDFPEHLRMFNLRQTFDFWCNPFQDVYPTDNLSFAGVTSNPLYNFQQKFITIHPPLYIAGYQSLFTQDRQQFFNIYPQTNNIQQVAVGDGTTTSFSGNIPVLFTSTTPFSANGSACFVKGNVLFSSVDSFGNGLAMVDVPILDSTTGNPTVWGNLYTPAQAPNFINQISASEPYTLTPGGIPNSNNYINYVTGNFTVTFPNAPSSTALINSQTIPQVCSLPQAMMWFDNQFTLRPIPDQPYQIQFEAYMRPSALLATNQSPQLQEWWQYIAYGAAKKIFEDKMDLDSVALILPEYKKQEALCLRRTIVQYTNERVATIYTEQTQFGPNAGAWGWGGGPF